MKYRNIKICLIFVLFIFVLPFCSNATTLFIAPQSKEVKVGDTFYVLLDVDSQGLAINAATADITFDNNLLSVQSVGFSNSIFTIWPEEPSYSNINGKVHFSGGIYSPGWLGSAGPILRITFKAKAVGQAKLAVTNASVLANDGIGTNVLNNHFDSIINIEKALPVIEKQISDIKTVSTSTAEKEIEISTIPIINNLPDQLMEGTALSFNVSSAYGGQTLLYIQKGKNNPEISQLDIIPDSTFNFTYRSPVSSGYYKIWARNILPGGVMSTSSDISYVEVINPNTINILSYNLTYKSIIIILIIISLTLLVFWIITIVFYLNNKQKVSPINKIKKEKKIVNKV
jgi:hypothetical protein